MYEYPAKLVRVIDGDTVELDVDLGFNVTVREKFRLAGIDTPELNSTDTEQRNRAVIAKIALVNLLKDQTLTITTQKDKQEKYGRYLCTLRTQQGTVNDMLVASGHAKPYDGGHR